MKVRIRSLYIFIAGIIGVILISSTVLVSYNFFKSNETPASEESTLSSGLITLPEPKTLGTMTVEESLAKRRSIRDYTDEPLTLDYLSQLVWAAQGITEPKWGLRTAPSAGATYPLEVYVIVGEGGVVGVEAGVYQYLPHDHQLKQTLEGDHRDILSKAALEQVWIATAPITIVISAIYERTTDRYGERGIRYVHMEVGHVGQNIYLEATALHLGAVVVGAFHDNQVQDILHLPEKEYPLYIIPVGHPQ